MKKYLVLPDVHVPFQDKVIISKILEMLQVVKVEGLIITGDFLDLFSLGSYNADSLGLLRDWNLSDEYEQGSKVLGDIIKAVGTNCKERHFIFGNHEDRYFRELKKGDRAKYGTSLVSPIDGLDLKKRGFEVIEDWNNGFLRIGKMTLSHGYYTSVNASKKALDSYQENSMFGHTHRFSSHVNGKYGAWNIGFLGDKDSKGFSYMHRGNINNWCNGFAFLNILDEDGSFLVEPIQIWDKKFIYNGKQY